jgi:predicted site-specific integrase-resolvase
MTGKEPVEPLLMDPQEAWTALGIKKTMFYSLVKKGVVRPIPQGARKRKYSRADILELAMKGWYK